jgi:hypothetical protein
MINLSLIQSAQHCHAADAKKMRDLAQNKKNAGTRPALSY